MKKSRADLLINTTLFTVTTLIGVLIIEFVALPIYATGRVDHDLALLGFYATPNSTVGDTKINADGFTGTELSELTEQAPGYKVLTLGGSTLFNRNMTERMQSELKQVHDENWAVTGGALRTHTSQASLIKYKNVFSKHKFDYVVIYHGVNDLWANNIPASEFMTDYSHMQPWYKRSTLLDASLIARYVYNSIARSTGIFPRDNVNASDFASNSVFKSNLTELITLIRANGAQPILMTFAWHIPEEYSLEGFKNYTVGYNNPSHYDECPVELWGTTTYVREGLNLHNQTVRSVAQENKTHLIELDAILSHDIDNFGDVVHLSELGTDRLVQNVGRALDGLSSARIH